MKTTSLMAGASRFAHFAGLTRASRRAAEDDRDENARAEDDDDDGKDAGDDPDEGDDKPAGKRSKRAEDDDDGKDAADDDQDGDDVDKPAGKRSRAEDDDDGKDAEDDDDELNGKGASAQARRREQSRISHILGNKAAAANLPLALSLACETRMSRQDAVRVLKSQVGQAGASDDRPNRHARSDRQDRNVRLGSDSQQPSGKQAVDASWSGAFAKIGVTAKPR